MYQRIRYFLKAAETGSFSLAAQSLYISPQALTKQIGVLERELGGKLFERSTQGVKLTEFGEYAEGKLGRLYVDFEDTVALIREYAKAEKTKIRIGIFAALPRDELVSPLVSFLLASFPEYGFHLEMIELDEGKRRLSEGRLDLLLTNVHEEERITGYRGYSFGEHKAKVVVSLNHPWVVKDRVTEEDLRSEPFIKMQVDMKRYAVPAEKSFYLNIPCSRVIPAENFETLLVLLNQAAGFGVFPLVFLNMEQARVKGFDYPGKTLRYNTALLVSEEKRQGSLKALVEELVREFELKELS